MKKSGLLLFLLILPLACSIFIWIFPYYLTKKQSLVLVTHLYLVVLFILFFIFLKFINSNTCFFLYLAPWINCGNLIVSWGFQFDSITLVMLGLVAFVSTAVHFFSLNYMAHDFNIIKFFSLLSLFTFFMFVLVSSDNFLVLFVGWEGIGICSFLLISFWHTRLPATKSALKAIVLNRIGDSAFLAAIAFLFLLFKSFDFSVIFPLIPYIINKSFVFLFLDITYVEIISFLFVIGSVGKSAQLGLHGWLPEAMEGPTPVSALIHAATLVTAGIFLIIRCSPIFEYASFTLNLILLLGGFTCLFGSTVACAQNDLKRIIAFSTTSQLGYMFFACGLSSYNVALFHLINHGFFKALLFLCAGAIIYSTYHEQDIRKFGGLIVFLPFVYSCFLISLLALVGFPFMSGFYSKELVIELAFSSFTFNSFFIFWISTISASLTAFYGFRCLYLTFLTSNNSIKVFIQNILVIGKSIIFALVLLLLGSIYSGILLQDLLVGQGSNFFGSSIYVAPDHALKDYEYLSWFIKNIPFFGTVSGICIALFFNKIFYFFFNQRKYKIFFLIQSQFDIGSILLLFCTKLKIFLNQKWFLDFLYNNYFGIFILKHSYETFYKLLDKGVLEILLNNGGCFAYLRCARYCSIQQNGYVYSTLCFLLICLILFINLTLWF